MRIPLACLLLVACASNPIPEAEAPPAADAGSVALDLSVSGARTTAADVCFAVFDSESAYEGDGSLAVFRGCVPFEAQPLRVGTLVDGRTYAVSAFLDANRNGKLDTKSFLGFDVPAEGYGFSNDPPQGVGAPSWSEVKFPFDAAHRGLVLALQYL